MNSRVLLVGGAQRVGRDYGRRLLVPVGTGLLVLLVGASNGGFDPPSWRWAMVALGCAAGAGLLLRGEIVLARSELVAVGAFLALAGWMFLSRSWSLVPELASLEAERTLLYAVGLLAFLVLFETEGLDLVLLALLGAITVLSVWGLADVASAGAGLPLVGPVGYANGAGVLAAIGIVVASGLAARLDTSRARAAVLLPLVVLLPTLALTKSVGAWLALLIGLVVALVPFGRASRWMVVSAGVLVVGAIGVIGIATALADNVRWTYWRIALDDVRAHPFLGSGAGTFGQYWLTHARAHYGALDAHSLYLESLAELGFIGLVLVGVFFVVVARACVKATGAGSVAAGAFAAYLVHAGVDWDWELPVVTITGLALAAVVLVSARRQAEPQPLSARAQLGLALVAICVAVLALVRMRTGATSL